MAFAIGFLILGIMLSIIGGALFTFFGIAIKITFSFVWFVGTGICICIALLFKFITFPFTLFGKKVA